MAVVLREVTEANWREVIALSVRPDQAAFVPSVAVSLAKAYIRPEGFQYDPFAVYACSADDQSDENTLVGFVLFLYNPKNPRKGYLDGLLIGETFQMCGYGRATIAAFLSLVRANYPSCRDLYLFVEPDNHAAQTFYERQGFRRFGVSLGGRIAYHFPLN